MNFEEIQKKINDMSITDLQNFIQELKYNFGLEENQEGSSPQYQSVINEINGLTVKQMNDLIKDLETSFGVKASASFGGGGESSEEGASGAAEKSSYTVVISGFKQDASQKIKFIQALRGQVPSIALKDALTIFDTITTGGNHTVFDNLGKDEAMNFKNILDPFVEVTLK
jgi:large subunit ribosomal protein L7/L12